MVRIDVYSAGGVRSAEAGELPALLAAADSAVWVDIEGPSDAEVELLHNVFHFHPLAVEDTRNQRQRPKVEEYEGYLFTILNPVVWRMPELEWRELDIFVSTHYLVTVHPGPEPAVEEARRRLGRATPNGQVSGGYLLYTALDVVVDGYFPVLDDLNEMLEETEDRMLTDTKHTDLQPVFAAKRSLLELLRVAGAQRDMFNVLTRRDLPYFPEPALQYYLRDVFDHLLRINDTLTTERELVSSLIELYLSAKSTQLNIIVNRLTIFTIVIGLMSVVTGLYGINTGGLGPSAQDSWGMPFVLAIMAVLAAGFLAVARRLEWW